jgi:DNA replication and repair protein RecF
VPRPETERVGVAAVTVADFRNYAAARLAAGEARLVALTGPNGAGKTNLIEAISLLTPGRGLRRAAYEELTRKGASPSGAGWAVAAEISRGGEETRIGTGFAAPGEGAARLIRINAANAPSADALLEHLRILWLTPAMDGLFTGPPSERRRFIDRLVLTVDATHGRRAREFDRLLTQRNRLLEESAAAGWLDAVEAELAARAVAVAFARREVAALLSQRIAALGAAPDAFPAASVRLAGTFEALSEGSAATAETAYRELLARERGRDRAAGRTLDGPHRSDLETVYAEKNMPAALCSTGEQKALLIGIILAHADLVAEMAGMTPVLLLDEVAAHLDPDRRAALFARIDALGAQAFMTGTDAALFEGLPAGAARFVVADGTIAASPR